MQTSIPEAFVPFSFLLSSLWRCIGKQTHLLGRAVVVGGIPLLGLVGGGGNLPGRLPELLGRGLGRHVDSLGWCLVWGVERMRKTAFVMLTRTENVGFLCERR